MQTNVRQRTLNPVFLFAVCAAMLVSFGARAQMPNPAHRGLPAVQPAPVADQCTLLQDKAKNAATTIQANDGALQQLTQKVAEIDAQLAALQSQIGTLNQEKAASNMARVQRTRDKARLQIELTRATGAAKRACEGNPKCPAYETKVDDLQKKMQPHRDRMAQVAQQLRAAQLTSNALDAQIAPIEKEYMQRNCPNLEPGKVAQAEIDKCTALFSQWNAVQTQINQLETEIARLRTDYKQSSNSVVAFNRQVDQYNDFLEKECRNSQRLVFVREAKAQREEYKVIELDLGKVEQNLKRLKGLKVTIQPMKIKMKLR